MSSLYSEDIESQNNEKKADEPEVLLPEIAEPEIAEPEIAEPEIAEMVIDEPVVIELEADELVANKPESDSFETIEPKTDEPKTDEPKTDEPKTDEPETDEPKTDEPEADEIDESFESKIENEVTLKNTIDFDGENESLWREVIEENSLPGFEIETVHQFRSFIKVGANILFDIGELQPDTPMTDDQKALIADLGQFINLHGSYDSWKSEKEKLVKEHNEAISDLKTIYKKYTDQKKRLELTLQENAGLISQVDEFDEEIKKFEDMKVRNVYLESEMKKFNALLGFTDLDITEELKKRIAETKTLDISSRFLHKAWKKLKKVLSPDKIVITELQKKIGEILNKPFNASKMRMNLIELIKEFENENADKKDRYFTLFDRSQSNPLNNVELKEFVDLSEYFRTLMYVLKKLMKAIETAKN
ncbi:MAG: hypothetical protein K8S87_12845 [Planctomycetes bacterium]|nr:hypothetical protein [Planctomycetota bacterium]